MLFRESLFYSILYCFNDLFYLFFSSVNCLLNSVSVDNFAGFVLNALNELSYFALGILYEFVYLVQNIGSGSLYLDLGILYEISYLVLGILVEIAYLVHNVRSSSLYLLGYVAVNTLNLFGGITVYFSGSFFSLFYIVLVIYLTVIVHIADPVGIVFFDFLNNFSSSYCTACSNGSAK